MSTDYAEMEREFVASLKEDTGRDLSGWMTAIADSGLGERNAIIDWLRHQGFQFAKASWLERIHHNGGRLIYADETSAPFPSARPRPSLSIVHAPPARVESPRPFPAPSSTRPVTPNKDIEPLLADAKGLRPLAELVLREIARTVPDAAFSASGSLIAAGMPETFAALQTSPKALRLYANFGAPGVHRAKPADAAIKSATAFAEVLILDDARSIDEDFLRLIRAAARL